MLLNSLVIEKRNPTYDFTAIKEVFSSADLLKGSCQKNFA